MRESHSPSFSTGRALSAGNEPTMPALHWAITSSGPETMNSGEPSTGSSRWSLSEAGSDMANVPSGRWGREAGCHLMHREFAAPAARAAPPGRALLTAAIIGLDGDAALFNIEQTIIQI